MAPNLAVKSESWLDLSKSVNLSNKLPTLNAKSHQISQRNSSYCPLVSLESEHNLSEKNNQHLLIRLRQQSYLRRSSRANSLCSNLSNSIEFNPSLLGANLRDQQVEVSATSTCQCWPTNQDDDEDAKERTRSSRAKPRLKRESFRLRHIRERLIGGHPIKSSRDEDRPSPLVRSLSSFSDRLGGKLSNLTHSCKNLLHNYNNHRQASKQKTDSSSTISCLYAAQRANDSPMANDDPLRQLESVSVNKRRLTDEWIVRHHGSEKVECNQSWRTQRPKSLQAVARSLPLDSSRGQLNDNDNRRERVFAGKSEIVSREIEQAKLEFGQRREEGKEEKSTLKSLTSSLSDSLASSGSLSSNLRGEKKVSGQPIASGQISSPNSSSSTTLVRPKSSENSLESLEEKSSTPSESSLGVCNQKKQPIRGSDLADQQLITSDYWSTVTSSGGYGKQSKEMAPGKVNRQQQQQQQQQPILINPDAEYYQDVLSVAKTGNQIGVQQNFNLSPLINNFPPDYLNSQMSPGAQYQPHLNLSSPVHQFNSELAFQQDEDYDDYAVPSDESCRLDRSQVELVQMIGEGQKGFVFLGKLQSKDGRQISDVAIKTLKYETEELIEKLMREAAMMRQFEHPHIIKFIGVCPETPALIAMELAQFGEVKRYLKLNRDSVCASQLVLFTFQISTALSYLESKQYVHRDVAARNVLVCAHNCVKLADFGLSRNLQLTPINATASPRHAAHLSPPPGAGWPASEPLLDRNYVAAPRVKLPVRWLAPESLALRRFTSASDVWMFAVCSWELFHLGQLRPWAQIRNNQVLAAIEAGQRLAKPAICPLRLYQLLLQCWSYTPIKRPKFRELKQNLWSIYLNERAREQLEFEQQQQQQRSDRIQLAAQSARQSNQFSDNHHHHLHHHHHHLNNFKLSPLNSETLFGEQQQRQQQQVVANQHRLSPFAANQPETSYRQQMQHSNSGYSTSTTATTADRSNNSSRSSSMGSQQQVANESSHWPAESKASNQQVVGKKIDRIELANQSSKNNLVWPPANVEPMKREENMRRFQRNQGNVLQKQRSQGSIAIKRFDLESNNNQQQQQQQRRQKTVQKPEKIYGFDDDALLASRRLPFMRRPANGLRAKLAFDNEEEEEEEEEEDEENEEFSSGGELDQIRDLRGRMMGNQVNDSNNLANAFSSRAKLSPQNHQMPIDSARQLFSQPNLVQNLNSSQNHSGNEKFNLESNYEGLMMPNLVRQQQLQLQRQQKRASSQVKEIAMIRGSGQQSPTLAPNLIGRQATAANILLVRPTVGPAQANKQSELIRAEHQPDELERQVNLKASLAAKEEEQKRQLALHQRLLGHIRLGGAGQRSSGQLRQRSVNLSDRPLVDQADCSGELINRNQFGDSKQTSSVDQSLQLLESLISENSVSGADSNENFHRHQLNSRNSDLNHNNNNNNFSALKQRLRQQQQALAVAAARKARNWL